MTIRQRMDAASVQRASSVPTLNAANERIRRGAALVTRAGLGGAAAIHLLWASGRSWPADSRGELADLVVGVRPFPSSGATLGVAAVIGVGTGLVLYESRRMSRVDSSDSAVSAPTGFLGRVMRFGAMCVPSVLALRGAGGLAASAFELGQATEVFRRWDLRVYSPLCLVLAISAYLAIRRGPQHHTPASIM